MSRRERAPLGAPCWAELATADLDASRRFYCELFGWGATASGEDSLDFSCDGVLTGSARVCTPARDDAGWCVYFSTDDLAAAVSHAESLGATLTSPITARRDEAVLADVLDPAGVLHGFWQASTFPGFTVLGEEGHPSWFELRTEAFAAAVDYYASVNRVFPAQVGDSDEFRYTILMGIEEGGELAGIHDIAPPGQRSPCGWSVYWHVADQDRVAASARDLGATVVEAPGETPHGVLCTIRDPLGTELKLRAPPAT
jgi:uncharacterized protein